MEKYPNNTSDQYDHSLTYFFWAWGCAEGFGDKNGKNGGFFDHRRESTSRLIQMIKEGNPWAPDPKSGRSAADFLWATELLPRDDFHQVMEACLTHPKAPDPSTWSNRKVFNSKEDIHTLSMDWIMALVRHPLGYDMVMPYAKLGGRLDAVDQHGYGILANCSNLSWSDIEKFLAAAEFQGVSVMAAPPGKTWMSPWKNMSPTELSQAQNELARLSATYPKACQSQIAPEDEFCNSILAAEGMRPTSSAWKRLGMEKVLKQDPEAFKKIFIHTVALAKHIKSVNAHQAYATKYSTLSYLAGRMSKLLTVHPHIVDTYQVIAAGFEANTSEEKVRNSLSLLSSGKSPIPAQASDFPLWRHEIRQAASEIDIISKGVKVYGWNKECLTSLLPGITKFVKEDGTVSQDQQLAFLDTVLDGYTLQSGLPNDQSWMSIIGQEEVIDIAATLPLTPAHKEKLVKLALDTLCSRPAQSFTSRLSSFIQGAEDPYLNYPHASPWVKNTIDEFVLQGDMPEEVQQSLRDARDQISNSRDKFPYMVKHLDVLKSYFGRCLLEIQASAKIAEKQPAIPKL